jgi:hypothetical protein
LQTRKQSKKARLAADALKDFGRPSPDCGLIFACSGVERISDSGFFIRISQHIGWDERSETHLLIRGKAMGFAKGSTHPTGSLGAFAPEGPHFPPGLIVDALLPHREPSLAMSSGKVHLPSRIKSPQPDIKSELVNTQMMRAKVGTRPRLQAIKESRAMAKRLDSGSTRRRVLCAYVWQHGSFS